MALAPVGLFCPGDCRKYHSLFRSWANKPESNAWPDAPPRSRCQYSNICDFLQARAYQPPGIAVIYRTPEAIRPLLKFLALSRILENEIQNTDTALDVADLRELIHSFV